MCVRIFNPIHIGWQNCEKRSRAEQRCPFSQTPVYKIHRLTLMLVLGAYIKSPFFPPSSRTKTRTLTHTHTHSDILIQKDLSRSLYYRVYSPKPASVKVLCTRLCSFTQSLSLQDNPKNIEGNNQLQFRFQCFGFAVVAFLQRQTNKYFIWWGR